MLLNISTLSGCLPPIEVSHDATTGDLKRRIQEVCPETASKRLRVMQRHEPSDEFAELDQIDQRLSSRGVSDGSELSLVIEELRAVDRTIVEKCLWQLSAAPFEHSASHAISSFVAAISGCNGTLDLSRLGNRLFRDRQPSSCDFIPTAQMLFTMTNSLNSCSSSISRLDLSGNVLTQNYLPFSTECLASNLSITELDLSGCQLNCLDAECLAEIIASNTTIKKLNISGNQVNSGAIPIFDALSRNQSITHFDMSFGIGVHYQHDILSHPLSRSLSSMIKSNIFLQKLNLSGLKLSEECFKQMAEALQTNRTITDLNISYNVGTPVGIAALTKMIASNSTIAKLVMCKVRGEAFTLRSHSLIQIQLYEALKRNTSITDLQMSCHIFPSDELANAFAGIISSNSTITRITLPAIHRSCAGLIFNALALNHCLMDVTVGFDTVHAELETQAKMLEALFLMIRCNSSISRLNLFGTFVEDDDSIGLAEALLQNRAIQELDLGSLRIGHHDCGHSFAKVIQSNSTLSKLCLKNHFISNNQMDSIANALTRNRTLTVVDLSIRFGRQTYPPQTSPRISSAITNMIASNSSIVILNLSGFARYFSDHALTLIAAALKINTTITSIDLSNCLKSKLSDVDKTVFNAAAFALADMITTNKTIVKLNLDDNWFESQGLISIARALKINAFLTEIDVCSENQFFGNDVVLAFCDIVPFNQTLKSISFCTKPSLSSTHETFRNVLLEYSQFKRPTPYML